jgi:hypothetical protein
VDIRSDPAADRVPQHPKFRRGSPLSEGPRDQLPHERLSLGAARTLKMSISLLIVGLVCGEGDGVICDLTKVVYKVDCCGVCFCTSYVAEGYGRAQASQTELQADGMRLAEEKMRCVRWATITVAEHAGSTQGGASDRVQRQVAFAIEGGKY